MSPQVNLPRAWNVAQRIPPPVECRPRRFRPATNRLQNASCAAAFFDAFFEGFIFHRRFFGYRSLFTAAQPYEIHDTEYEPCNGAECDDEVEYRPLRSLRKPRIPPPVRYARGGAKAIWKTIAFSHILSATMASIGHQLRVLNDHLYQKSRQNTGPARQFT